MQGARNPGKVHGIGYGKQGYFYHEKKYVRTAGID
jgi:hypothetical protein